MTTKTIRHRGSPLQSPAGERRRDMLERSLLGRDADPRLDQCAKEASASRPRDIRQTMPCSIPCRWRSGERDFETIKNPGRAERDNDQPMPSAPRHPIQPRRHVRFNPFAIGHYLDPPILLLMVYLRPATEPGWRRAFRARISYQPEQWSRVRPVI